MSIRTRITRRIRHAIDGARDQARALALSALGLEPGSTVTVAPAGTQRRAKAAANGIGQMAGDAFNAGGTKSDTFSAAGRQPRVPVIDEWDVVQVREALRQHELGIFQKSALFAEHMDRQDRIGGVLDTRVNAVLSMPREVKVGADSDTARAAAAAFRGRWGHMVTRGTRAAMTRWMVKMGFVVCQRVWERDPRTGAWDIVLEPWHPTWILWDHARGVYRITTTTGIEECPPDGSNPRWCVIPLLDEFRPWMQGAIRRLAIPFLIISWAYRDWARWSEKHGLPPLGASVPSGERFRKETEQFLADLEQLASEPTILLPEGFDLQWKELKGWQSYQGFRDLARGQETNVAIVLLGQNLTTEVTGGSFAAARAHELVRRDFLTGTAQAVDEGERIAVAVPWCRANIEADPIAAELAAPRPTTDTTPPVDAKDRVGILTSLGTAIKALQDAGIAVDAVALARQYDVPVLDVVRELNGQIYQWHVAEGVVTRDEARARLGFATPLPNGAGSLPPPQEPVPTAPPTPPPATPTGAPAAARPTETTTS